MAARLRGYKQRKLNDHVYSFLFFVSPTPHYQAEFFNIAKVACYPQVGSTNIICCFQTTIECQGLHIEGKCIASPCLNCVSKKDQEVLEVVALTFCKIIVNL